MAAFHVFVEGATDASPAGLSRLADAIAAHYGLPAADLLARLQKGRFRVKGNIDRATAETYARDLQKLGARCAIEEATAANSQRTTPIPFPAVQPPAGAALPPSPVRPTPPSGLAAARPSTPAPAAGKQEFQSGLSAAFSGEMPAADLGALGRADAPFSLSTVDGADDKAGAGGSFGPPAGGLPASIGPAPDKPAATSAKPARPKDEPIDMFAPPEMQGDEFKVDIADDDRAAVQPRGGASVPPPAESSARPSSQKIPTTSAGRGSQPSLPAANAPVTAIAPSSSKLGPLAEPRNRFAAGLLLAILIGFVPAHFIAQMREESAYAEVDKKVIAAQQLADTPDSYAALDKLRADQLSRKESEQRNAALIGFAIWGLVGAAVAYGFFKKIPWE